MELGRDPTPAEAQARYDAILAAQVRAGLPRRFRRERERYLKFDLEPFEFASLQQKRVLVLEHYILEIVKMRDSIGGTVYYRDQPDTDKGDNLLKLPRRSPARWSGSAASSRSTRPRHTSPSGPACMGSAGKR